MIGDGGFWFICLLFMEMWYRLNFLVDRFTLNSSNSKLDWTEIEGIFKDW